MAVPATLQRAAAPAPGHAAETLHRTIFALLAVALLALPFVPVVGYPFFLMQVLCFALFACAFNLMLGYGGLLSFGHAAFFGMGSYVSAYLAKEGFQLVQPRLHLAFRQAELLDVTLPVSIVLPPFTPELAVLAGAAAGVVLGLAFGLLAIRRQGIYFAMITLALAQMVFFFARQAQGFTGGENGIQGVPRNELFGVLPVPNDLTAYYVVVAVFVVGVLVIHRTIHSPFGQVLKAIRDNEPRAVSLGYHVARYKLTVFVLSATLAALAGALKAFATRSASDTDVMWSMSGEVVLMTLLGGMGTVFGPMVGATVIVGLKNFFATFGAWVLVIEGVIFVLCVLLFREGVIGVLSRFLRRPL